MKNTFYISSPFDTYSGYGARSRDLIKAIIKSDKYNVKLLSQRWGNTPFGFCSDHEEWSFLLDYVHDQPQFTEQPDIWMQITVPNEFQPVGKYNIGVTAGMETTIVHGSWVEGINRMDLNLVSSEHSKQVFLNSKFESKNQQGQSLGIVEVTKPIEVLFEGADIEIYKSISTSSSYPLQLDIKEDFAFLFVGHWLQGELGEDRKNVGLLIKAFYEVYKNQKNKPALILKTNGAGASYMDREDILKKIQSIKSSVNSNDLPNIYLLHGELTDIEMNALYNHPKVKAMVSLTKGEGFGRPLLEFSLSKKPIMVSGWSGHMDFINPEFSAIIGGNLKNVHPSAVIPNMILAESQWFSPDHGQIGTLMKDIQKNYKNYLEKAKRQAYRSKTEFNWEKMKEKLDTILSKNLPNLAKKIELKLPELKLPNL
jgi:glycosyltransferase involved in cell wall biosynthesis